MNTALTVARTILAQLGGNGFRVMTGAKNFVAGENYLSFQIPRAKSGIRGVRIELTPMDTYTVTFMKWRKFDVTVVSEVTDVYADQLEAVFTGATGLYTRI